MCPVFGGSGGDRLSRVLRHSTMGAGVFNGRVRDGIGFWAHRSGHQTGQAQVVWDVRCRAGCCDGGSPVLFGKQVRATVRVLRAGPCLVLRPLRRSCADRCRSCWIGYGGDGSRETIKSIGRLVPVSSARCRACTSGLSTWSSSTALKGDLVSRGVSRLDAFSGYPVRT